MSGANPWVNGPLIDQGNAAITGGNTPVSLARSSGAITAPADTTEDTLVSVAVPILTAQARLQIVLRATMTGAATARTLRIRYSGASGTVYFSGVSSSGIYIQVNAWIANRGATNSQEGGYLASIGNTTLQAPSSSTTSAVDTTAATTLLITAQKVTAGDSIVLEGYEVWLLNP